MQTVLLSHGDSVDRLGDRLRVGARSHSDIICAIYNEQLRVYGVQFHPEVIFCPFNTMHIFIGRGLNKYLNFTGRSHRQGKANVVKLLI